MWLIGAMVCLLAALWVQLSVSMGNGWPHNALRRHWLMPISCHFRNCQSAAGHESDSCKRCYNKCPDLYLYLNCPMCFSDIFNLRFTNHVLNTEFVSEISYRQWYSSYYVTY